MAYSHIVVMVTTASKEEAEKITQCLLDEKLIACANILGPVSSLFWWNEKIERAEEYIILMKSRINLFEKLSEKVRALHSYEVPEIVALPIIRGYKPYIGWLRSVLR